MEQKDRLNQINENLFFGKRGGLFIEIGAGSNGIATELFENELGWTGILVEPNPVSYQKLVQKRRNSRIINTPISIYPTVMFHSYYGDSADMSAIEETVNDDIATVYYNDEIIINEKKMIDELETKCLTDIIHQPYDFMVIDTNGHELEVLQSWDFSQSIQYIIFYTKTMEESRLDECETVLKINNYILVDRVLIDNKMFDVWKKEAPTSCVLM
jgi:hypothetical protein